MLLWQNYVIINDNIEGFGEVTVVVIVGIAG